MVPPIIADTKIQTRRLTGLDKVNEYPDEWFYNGFVGGDGLGVKNNLPASQHHMIHKSGKGVLMLNCPYGKKGDVLWVRESFLKYKKRHDGKQYFFSYKAGHSTVRELSYSPTKWKPSIHMPRSACRLFLLNKGVSIERIQDISEEDCIKEGIEKVDIPGRESISDTPYKDKFYKDYLRKNDQENSYMHQSPIESFRTLWNSIHGQWKWSKKKNAFVCYPWCIEDRPIIPSKYRLERDLINVTFKSFSNPWVWAVNFSRINDYKK